jgi:metal-responsive CopG/Arc/MetJ family transcriptional regulator
MSQRHIYCLTLRLEPAFEELVAEAAFEHGVTRSDWIRMAIRSGLKSQRHFQEQHDQRTATSNRG